MDSESTFEVDTTNERGRRTGSSQRPRRQPPQSYSSPLPQQPWGRASPPSPRLDTEHSNAPQQQRPPSFRSFLGRRQGNADQTTAQLIFQDTAQNNSDTLQPPDLFEPSRRAVSQPNTPAPWEQYHEPLRAPEQPLALLPRSPTYPPATSRRRVQSVSNIADAPFTDDEEFRLFVEATAGLGPEQSYRQSTPTSDSASHGNMRADEGQLPGSEGIVSPIQETPTTMYALQQLAQLPDASHARIAGGERPPQGANSQQISAAISRTNVWLLEDPYEGDYADGNDDELPDYAQSQAEAQAAQRLQAARRAQELQRRWQQSR